jgi:hypothetical protein
MNNVATIIDQVGRWNPADLAFIETLTFMASSAEAVSTLTLTAILQRRDMVSGAWPSQNAPCFRVVLKFVNIHQLRLQDFDDQPVQIMGFSIDSLDRAGWENVQYSVDDYEGSKISFRCMAIDVLDLIRLPRIPSATGGQA